MGRPGIRSTEIIIAMVLSAAAAACSEANAGDTAACGTAATVTHTVTLTKGAPTFYLATPSDAKTGDASCETSFDLTWSWADTVRARSDASAPPLNDLAHAFEVNMGLSYFPYSMAPTRQPPYDWYVADSDHDAGNGATTTYSITTSLTSGAAAVDSISVTGTIDYYH